YTQLLSAKTQFTEVIATKMQLLKVLSILLDAKCFKHLRNILIENAFRLGGVFFIEFIIFSFLQLHRFYLIDLNNKHNFHFPVHRLFSRLSSVQLNIYTLVLKLSY